MRNGPSTFSQRFEFHAYVSVAMMIGVLDGTFKTKLPGWKAKLTEMIPSCGRSIAEDAASARAYARRRRRPRCQRL